MAENIYPILKIAKPQNPNRLYAIPLLGILIKLILLIPVIIFIYLIVIYMGILLLINSFIVLFTGKYWQTSFNLNLGFLRYIAKIYSYSYGLTDKYPGFNFQNRDDLSVEMSYPQHSNRLFAIPFAGGIIRYIATIPFIIFSVLVSYGTSLAFVVYAWISVLFMGKYPEHVYELASDTIRLNLSYVSYLAGMTDSYPSFKISMNHKNIKIVLIGIATAYLIWSILFSITHPVKPNSLEPQSPTPNQNVIYETR